MALNVLALNVLALNVLALNVLAFIVTGSETPAILIDSDLGLR